MQKPEITNKNTERISCQYGHPGAQPDILIGGANNNQVSTFKYILPLVFKASSTKCAFFWRFFF